MSAVPQTTKEAIRTTVAQRKAENLDFVQQMLRELRDMTDAEDEQFISYLIGMAYVATSDVIRTRYANLVSMATSDGHDITGR